MNPRRVSRRLRPDLTIRLLVLCGLALTAAVLFSSVGGRAIGLRPGLAKNAPAPVAATITVNSTSDAVADDGQCTLREAITSATNDAPSGAAAGECAAGSGDDTINIAVTGTINLLSDQLSITTNVSITGPGSNLLTVRRGGSALHRIFFINAATVAISGMTITNGAVVSGGGAGGGLINGGAMTLTDVVVAGNRAGGGAPGAPDGGPGGGIYNVGTLSMTDCTVSDNAAGDGTLGGNIPDGVGGSGGGIFSNGTLTMANCTVSGNRAGPGPRGGGTGSGIFSGGTTTLTNVTISNNFGEGIRVAAGTLTITNSTVAANTFSHGIANSGTANVRNTIIARNGNGGSGPDVNGTFNSLGNNIVGNADSSTGFTNGSNGDQVGIGAAPVDPLLAPLSNYGGPTQTHALLPGSPAIDAGTSTGAPAQDQRGVNRVGAVDVGAFESRGFNLAATAGTPQSAPIGGLFSTQLAVAVSSAFGEPVAGGLVTFNAPTSGPSGTFPGGGTKAAVFINVSGGATAPFFRANGFAGSYDVTVGARGISSPAAFSLTNTRGTTNITVNSSANPSNFGQSVTFTATAAATALSGPTGTVQFKVDGIDLGGPVALVSGIASITTSTLTSGTHTITADYSGDANYNPSSGTLAGGQFVRPTLSVNDVSLAEGDSGTTFAVFTLTLSAASPSTITVNFATANGTANAPSDYQSTGGTLTFDPGQTTRTVNVQVNGDTSHEADETFFLNLSMPVNVALTRPQATGTILDDDPEGGRIRFTSATFGTSESAGSTSIAVERAGDTSRAVTVDYATFDLTASQRSDYILALGTLSFAAGETIKTFAVLINQDSHIEGTEALSVGLNNPTGGAVIDGVTSATLEITDDVPESAGNPIDGSEAFVRQHYHDFLNREPDASGLQFWTNQITSCGTDAGCREVRRINVSAAFFLSIEFQETGYLVYRTFGASFGATRVGAAVPLTLREFLPDTQRLGLGVVVNSPGWEQALEANKRAYFDQFVLRPQFLAQYPQTMAAAQFVDALNTNTGGSLSPVERDALVNDLTTAAKTRAQVLRIVAEDADFDAREKNRAFVLMQYFGYLRRNPNDPPELNLNFDGYNFWLTKLNNHGGNFIAAEMVKAFITSGEYRQRFGPN